MQNIIWGYHVGLVDSKIYCNDFMPKEKHENGKAIKKEILTRNGILSIKRPRIKIEKKNKCKWGGGECNNKRKYGKVRKNYYPKTPNQDIEIGH